LHGYWRLFLFPGLLSFFTYYWLQLKGNIELCNHIEMENLPTYISLVFGLTTILTVWLFYKSTNHSKKTLLILVTWLALQTFIGLSGFYTVTDTIPPRILFLVLPPILFIIGLFTTSKGRQFIDSLDTKTLTILHIVRVPVEIVLFWLFVNKTIPELMTFEGRNFDILSGLTTPIVFYFGFMKKQLDRKVILIWNFIGLKHAYPNGENHPLEAAVYHWDWLKQYSLP